MRAIIEQAIVSSRQADLEAREETVREHILRTIRTFRRSRPKVTIDDIVEKLKPSFTIERIFNEMSKLKEEKIIEFRPDLFQPDTEVHLLSRIGIREFSPRNRPGPIGPTNPVASSGE
jgi:hypothetical protein